MDCGVIEPALLEGIEVLVNPTAVLIDERPCCLEFFFDAMYDRRQVQPHELERSLEEAGGPIGGHEMVDELVLQLICPDCRSAALGTSLVCIRAPVVPVLADLHAATGDEAAVVVAAPAGAGKSYLVESTVDQLRPHQRVVVAAPTNEQAFDLTRRISDRLASSQPGEHVFHLHKQKLVPPPDVVARPNVTCLNSGLPSTAGIVVGTIDKLADAFLRGNVDPRDVLVIDEAYQASASHYLRIGGVAPTHLLVGDPGQIDPFSTISDGDHWRGLPEDPVQTAVSVLLRNHPGTMRHRLPITRRLAPSAAATAAAFYPGHEFGPAVRDGVRQFALPAAGRRRSATDRVIDQAAQSGWGYLELPAGVCLAADPQLIDATVGVVERILDRRPTISCERFRAGELRDDRVAVAVSHRDQVSCTRGALDALGLTDVVVDTANRLQGLEFDFVVAIHPLAGLAEADPFHLDPGRLCVMLTRHRHACVVIGRSSDEELLGGVAPATPAYLG